MVHKDCSTTTAAATAAPSAAPSSTINLTERGRHLFSKNLLGTSRSVIQSEPQRPVFQSSPLRKSRPPPAFFTRRSATNSAAGSSSQSQRPGPNSSPHHHHHRRRNVTKDGADLRHSWACNVGESSLPLECSSSKTTATAAEAKKSTASPGANQRVTGSSSRGSGQQQPRRGGEEYNVRKSIENQAQGHRHISNSPQSSAARLNSSQQSQSSGNSSSILKTPQRFKDREQDINVIKRREKQISMGKQTLEYEQYLSDIPKQKRSPLHPFTPKKYQVCSRRSYDAQIKIWRKKLHHWHDYSIDIDSLFITSNLTNSDFNISDCNTGQNNTVDNENTRTRVMTTKHESKQKKISNEDSKRTIPKKVLFEANR